MTMPIADLPLWMVIAVSTLLLIGSGLTLLGAFGLLRLPTFYERIHAPTLGQRPSPSFCWRERPCTAIAQRATQQFRRMVLRESGRSLRGERAGWLTIRTSKLGQARHCRRE